MKVTKLLLTLLVYCIPAVLLCQFPSLEGKGSSGIVSVFEGKGKGYNVNYEVAKSEIGFSFIRQEPIDEAITLKECATLNGTNYSRVNITLGLDEFTFNPLGSKANPELNLSYAISKIKPITCRIINKKGGVDENISIYKGFQIKPTFFVGEKDAIRFASESNTDLVKSRPVEAQIGVNLSLFKLADSNKSKADWAWGLSTFVGINLNDTQALEKRSFCEIIDSSSLLNGVSVQMSNCNDFLFGEPTNGFVTNLKFDFAKRISKPFKGTSDRPRFKNPALFFIGRVLTEYNSNNGKKIDCDVKIGFSLARTDRQVYASTLISLVSLLKNFNNDSNNQDASDTPIVSLEIPFN